MPRTFEEKKKSVPINAKDFYGKLDAINAERYRFGKAYSIVIDSARAKGDFELADSIRHKLEDEGFTVMINDNGTDFIV